MNWVELKEAMERVTQRHPEFVVDFSPAEVDQLKLSAAHTNAPLTLSCFSDIHRLEEELRTTISDADCEVAGLVITAGGILNIWVNRRP